MVWNGIPMSDTSDKKFVFKGIIVKRLNVVILTIFAIVQDGTSIEGTVMFASL